MRISLAQVSIGFVFFVGTAHAAAPQLQVGDPAPLFTAKTHKGEAFDLASRKGHWTVLYFYPKAATPGCTKQANAFSDHLSAIRAEDAEVYGVSVDSIEDQASFHDAEDLGFTLLADPQAKVVKAYGAKMPLLDVSRRWTFIIDPELRIRHIEHDVDPAADAERVASEIARLKAAAAKPAAAAQPE